MDPNYTLVAGITVAKLNDMQNSLRHSEALNDTLLSIISIYANEENYTQKGLNHNLALDFLEKLKEQNIIQKFEIKPTDDKPPPKSTSKFKPRLV
jgi:hypothetical protein